MKTISITTKLLCILLVIGFSQSCKKDDGPSDEQILKNKITDIIPQKYLDTLKNLGLVVNDGTTPPNVVGIYDIKPLALLKSNIASDYVGMAFTDAKLKLFNQSTADFGIQLYGKYFLNKNDTSIVTAISGSGTAFTVYGKVKSVSSNGVNSAVFAIVLSASIDGTTLKNVKYGLINIDHTNGGTGIFIKEGQGRIVYDTDFSSPANTVFGITIPTLPAAEKMTSSEIAR